MVHEMKLRNDPFQKIQTGKKTIELRLFDEKRRKIGKEDLIIFTSIESGRKILTKVVGLKRASCFEKLFDKVSLSNCGFIDGISKKEAANEMRAYYSEEEQSKFEVVAIQLDLIEPFLNWFKLVDSGKIVYSNEMLMNELNLERD